MIYKHFKLCVKFGWQFLVKMHHWGVPKLALKSKSHMCQKFVHGQRVVEQEKTLIGPLGIAQGLHHCSKVGQNDP